MPFSSCLSRKRSSWDLARACDGLFPLPVEEKGSIVAKSVCPGCLFPLPQGKKVNRGHRNVGKKCTGTKLTDFIPSLRLYKECVSRTQEEAIRLTSPAIARRARRQPGELALLSEPGAAGRALFPPLCGLRPHYEQKHIWTETPTKRC